MKLNSDQFVTVYRGLAGIDHPEGLDPELIGPHWTHIKEAAQGFAGKTGSVVTAQVNKKHLLQDSSTGETHPDLLHNYGMGYDIVHKVFPDDTEMETFVRPGNKVHITHMETHPDNPIRDKWEFNPPMVRNSTKLWAYTAKADDGPEPDWDVSETDPEYDYKTAEPGDVVEWHKGED